MITTIGFSVSASEVSGEVLDLLFANPVMTVRHMQAVLKVSNPVPRTCSTQREPEIVSVEHRERWGGQAR